MYRLMETITVVLSIVATINKDRRKLTFSVFSVSICLNNRKEKTVQAKKEEKIVQ